MSKQDPYTTLKIKGSTAKRFSAVRARLQLLYCEGGSSAPLGAEGRVTADSTLLYLMDQLEAHRARAKKQRAAKRPQGDPPASQV